MKADEEALINVKKSDQNPRGIGPLISEALGSAAQAHLIICQMIEQSSRFHKAVTIVLSFFVFLCTFFQLIKEKQSDSVLYK